MDIRTRLTCWFLLIVLVLLAAFSMTIFQLTKNDLLDMIEQDVHHQAEILQAATHVCPDPGVQKLCVPALDVFYSPDTFLQLQDQYGAILAKSGNLGKWKLPLLPAAIDKHQVEELPVEHASLFVYGEKIIRNRQVMGYIIVAHSPQSIYMALNQLKSVLYPGVLIALALAAPTIWLLVWQAIRPLEDLATTAAEITVTKDHSRRLSMRKRADQIGRLEQTMNKMLQALEDAYQEVQKVNDLQRHFLVDVSHELRTPLTVMLSSLDLMKKVGTSDPEFQASSLERLHIETERMARMVTQLLILARSDAHVTAAYEPILVGDMLADLCSQRHGTGHTPTLTCQHLELLDGVLVWGNADYIKQLFLILLDNSYKYTPATGKVTIEGEVNAKAVTISVTDTGIGIPAADLPRIFERFHRAENARYQPGAGLGLAIAQRITEQHRGSIQVESELGQGSSFIVTFPCL
ncbi:MAG TPA: HAMP domain-containing sensor histidine kinase [Ktedonobacteraceae bacterium]